jgi:hypothetical protein
MSRMETPVYPAAAKRGMACSMISCAVFSCAEELGLPMVALT